MKLSDRTGQVPRVLGLVGLLALIATVMWMPEPPSEPDGPNEPLAAEAPPEPPPAPLELKPSGTVDRLRRLIPLYPGVELLPMGQLKANGNPMEMGFFEVKATAREVMDFYIRQFEQRGRRVVEQPDGAGGGAVNYYDEKLGALVTVNVMSGGSPTAPRARVFPSIVEAPEGIHLQVEAPVPLPRPSGLLTVLRVDDQSPGPAKDSSTLTQIAQGTPEQLAAFYRQEMSLRRFTTVGARRDQDVEMLDFERRGERVSITLSPMRTAGGAPETIIAVVMEKTSQEVRP